MIARSLVRMIVLGPARSTLALPSATFSTSIPFFPASAGDETPRSASAAIACAALRRRAMERSLRNDRNKLFNFITGLQYVHFLVVVDVVIAIRFASTIKQACALHVSSIREREDKVKSVVADLRNTIEFAEGDAPVHAKVDVVLEL